tara:strand:- start:2047 stop:2754 length:708 start_codon:yes stop_codon:yes gene_type:complete
MREKLLVIKESSAFQLIVTAIILLSSIIVGVGTYEIVNDLFLRILLFLDTFITIFFVVEILIRFFAEHRKVDFFRSGWNIFDLIIVISSLIPTTGSSVLVLRLLRLARLLRVISFIPELRFVIEALIDSLKKSIYVLILIFILLYIYAVGGVILFEDVAGGRFEDLGEAFIALIQIMTLSSWESLMMPIVEIYPYAWMYFISFVILSSIIVLNLFVAILVDVVSERRKRQEEEGI